MSSYIRKKLYEDALEQIERFVHFYNGQRPHYSIGMQTPCLFLIWLTVFCFKTGLLPFGRDLM